MKKIFWSKIACVLVLIFSLFALTACELPGGGEDPGELLKLSSPTSIRVEDNIVYWSSVTNAGSYIIQVGDESHQAVTSELKYPLSALLSKSESDLYVKVKAKPSNLLLYTDSDWSQLYGPFDYIKSVAPSVPGDENPQPGISDEILEKIDEYDIGYGYNFLEDAYFDQTNMRDDFGSVLDIDSLLSIANFDDTYIKNVQYKGEFNESLDEFLASYSSSMSLGSEGAISNGIASVTAKESLAINKSAEFSGKSHQLFYNYRVESEYKDWEFDSYKGPGELVNHLSDSFLELINSDKTIDQKVNDILKNYGTHVILGVKTGGRIDYLVAIVTNSISLKTALSKHYNSALGVSVSDWGAQMTASANYSQEIKTEFNKSTTKKQEKIYITGGSHNKAELGSFDEFQDSWTEWSNSVDDSRVIGVSKAVSIVEILIQSDQYKALAEALQDRIEEKANEAYDDICSIFSVNELGSEYNPHKISTYDDLMKMKEKIDRNSDKVLHFELTNDIDWNDTNENGESANWNDYAPQVFKGIFNGNGYTISNLRIEKKINGVDSDTCFGFIKENQGIIKNINFVNPVVNISKIKDGQQYMFVGVVAGRQSGDNAKISHISITGATIDAYHERNVKQNGDDTSVRLRAGGVVGLVEAGKIMHCYVANSELSSTSKTTEAGKAVAHAGGIAGRVDKAEVTYSIVKDVKISSNAIGTKIDLLLKDYYSDVYSYAGGIAGTATDGATIEKCMHIITDQNQTLEATYQCPGGTREKATGSIVGNGADSKGDLKIRYCLYMDYASYTGEKYVGAGKYTCENVDAVSLTNINDMLNIEFKNNGWKFDDKGYPQLVLPRAGG